MYSDRLMRSMLQGFGMDMFSPFPNASQNGQQANQQHPMNPFGSMVPHGFMPPMMSSMMMIDPFQSMQQAMSMANNGTNGGFSYCSSSVTSYSTDEHGRPQVYHQSNEVKSGPDGLKETRSAVRDSRTGHQEMAIGHHMHDKAHIKKKSKNLRTGEEEHVEDFVNLEEEESEAFEQNWTSKARSYVPNQLQYGYPGSSSRQNRLALTSGEDTPHRQSHIPLSSDKTGMKAKKKKKSPKDMRM